MNTGNVKKPITVVGSFANIQAGQTLKLQGTWTEHPQYGSQFQGVETLSSSGTWHVLAAHFSLVVT